LCYTLSLFFHLLLCVIFLFNISFMCTLLQVKRTTSTCGASVTIHQAQQHQLPYSTSIKNALDRFLARVLVFAQCGGDLRQGSGSAATPSWLLAWQVNKTNLSLSMVRIVGVIPNSLVTTCIQLRSHVTNY
jgi:hypothetical protein